MKNDNIYQHLIETAPDAVCIHVNGYIVYVNPACLKLFAHEHQESFVGRPVLDFVHPHFRATAISRMEYMQRQVGNTAESTTERMIRPDGTDFYADITAVGINYEGKSAVYTLLRNATEREEMRRAIVQKNEELVASEARYRLIAENMSDLICTIDGTGRITYASPSHKSLLGLEQVDLLQQPFTNLVSKEDAHLITQNLKASTIFNDSEPIQLRYKHNEGHLIWVEVKAAPIRESAIHKEYQIVIVSRDIRERKRSEELLHVMAFQDPLTGLPNRRQIFKLLEEGVDNATARGSKLAVLYIDCDNFKQINDTHGHDFGDEFLVTYAKRLKDCLNSSDTLARLGGDEFIVLMPDVLSRTSVNQFVSRLTDVLEQPWNVGGVTFVSTSSVGVAVMPYHGSTVKELLANADQALFQAKNAGKNKFQFATPILGRVPNE